MNNRIKKLIGSLSNPFTIICIVGLILLSYVILFPLFQMIKGTFLWNQSDVRMAAEAVPGQFTLYHWIRVLFSDMSRSLFYKPFGNTVAVGVVTAMTSMLIGSGMAWFIVRTDMRFKKIAGFLAIVPYLLPSWVYSLAWLNIFKNDKIGGTPGLMQSLLHISPPDWVSYGFVPIVISSSIHDSVFFYLIVGSALSSVNSSLEEAAAISGAGRLTVLRRIVFPVVLPSILSAFILIFTKAVSSFGVPALLGLPVNFYTISTMLYSSMRIRMLAEANVLSIILIALSMITIFFNSKLTGGRKGFVTITGRGGSMKLTPLGRGRQAVSVAIAAGLFLVSIVPLLSVLLQTFLRKEGVLDLSNLTLHYWVGGSVSNINSGEPGVFHNSGLMFGLKNSLSIAVVSSLVAAAVGLIFGYVIVKGRGRGLSKWIEQVSFIPYLIPGISLSTVYITMFAKPSLLLPALYGTLTLLILITVVKELPFTTRAGSSSMKQISEELEEAAQIAGASWLTKFRRILLPLNKKSLFSSFLLVFIGAMKEMELIIILVSPRTETLTTLTFYYAEKGYTQLTDAILILIIFIIITVYFIVTAFSKADLATGIGG